VQYTKRVENWAEGGVMGEGWIIGRRGEVIENAVHWHLNNLNGRGNLNDESKNLLNAFCLGNFS